MWRIYYSDHEVTGNTRADWLAAPSEDVQAVALYEPTTYRGWRGANGDRQLWTGDDVFDPFGYGPKLGRLIADADYFAIWERAIADNSPSPG